jgi:hypothetical protein
MLASSLLLIAGFAAGFASRYGPAAVGAVVGYVKSIDFNQCDFTYSVKPGGTEYCADEGDADNFYHVDPDEIDAGRPAVVYDDPGLICYRDDYFAYIPEGQEGWNKGTPGGWWCVRGDFIHDSSDVEPPTYGE